MSQPVWIAVVIAAYFAVWVLISYFSSRGADSSTFYSAGRKMPWPLVAIAMLGAPITGVTFISVPGMVMAKGLSYLQMCMGFIVGYLVIAFVLVPLYYRLNVVSVYGYLEQRFGRTSSRTGAWLFFVSKIFGISIRFLIVCAMLQLLVFDPLGIPYIWCVMVSMTLVWLTTYKGGVKSVIWTDVLKSFCLIAAVGLSLFYICSDLNYSLPEISDKISSSESSRLFFFDDPSDSKYFWKQFVAGIFIVIAMTGLDQDMMQRTLACRNAKDSAKNLVTGTILQTVIITLLLFLGLLLLLFAEAHSMPLPDKSDNLFASVAFHSDIPVIVGVLFILGLIAATFASVGSALTAMTTTMTMDILEPPYNGKAEAKARRRKAVHGLISLAIAVLVIFFYYLNQEDAISTVYTLISYTDGPILGLFLFGLLTKRTIDERWLPVVCIAAPVACWFMQWGADYWFDYQIGYELLLLNAAFTFAGMSLLSTRRALTQAIP